MYSTKLLKYKQNTHFYIGCTSKITQESCLERSHHSVENGSQVRLGHGHEEREEWWDERNLHGQWHLYLGKKEGYLIQTSGFEANK